MIRDSLRPGTPCGVERLALVIGSIVVGAGASAGDGDPRVWRDHTYDKQIAALSDAGSTLLLATTGGGAIAWSTIDDTFEKHTRNNHGLPSNFVSAAVEHPITGDVWAATERGLGRLPGGFDSDDVWEIIDAPNGPQAGMLMTDVVVDQNGHVWAATFENGLFQFDGAMWLNFTPDNSGLSDVFVTSIAVGLDNELWIGAWGDGVDRLADGVWTNFDPISTGTPPGCSELLSMPPGDLGLVSVFVEVLGVDPATGDVWFANDDDGFCLLEGVTRFDGTSWSTFTMQNSALPSNTVTSADFDGAGIVRIGTASGIVRLETGAVVPELGPFFVSALQTIGDDLWIGTLNGFGKYDGQSLIAVSTNCLEDNVAWDVAESPAGDIWIGGRGGAQRFLGEGWSTFTTQDGLPNNDVRALEFDGAGTLYLGTWGGGLARFDGLSVDVMNPGNSGICCTNINALEITGAGEIWAGSFLFGGLSRFNGASWQPVTPQNSGIPSSSVNVIKEAPNGDLWFGTSAGAARLSGGVWTVFDQNNGLPANAVRGLGFEPGGAVWVGTTNGAARFDGLSWTVFTTVDGLPGNDVRSIAHDPFSGDVWFGVWNAGAARYDGALFESFNTSNGLINDRPLSILAASNDDLWFATDFGVSQFAASEAGSPADLNGDGVVDGADLAALLAQWGGPGGSADLNDDGVVNGADLAALLAAWS